MRQRTIDDINELSARDMCLLFPFIKNRIGALGLFKSMHAFDEAQNALGWDVAESLEKKP